VLLLAVVLAFASAALAATYFKEEFDPSSWASRWVVSEAKGAEAGKFDVTAGEWFGDATHGKGLATTENNRFYQASAAFPKFSNKGKTVVLQYNVKFPQNVDCGGGYLKVGPSGMDGKKFHGDSEYNLMFGPDFCGSSTNKVHVILSHGGKNHLIKKSITPKKDQLSHLYTLVLSPDNSYEVLIDQESAQKGKIEEDWDILPPKKIKDPKASKPADWVDEAKIADPTDVKPVGWDDTPATIIDKDAKKPEDWDDELDGSWEPPTIANPEYKGEWKPKMIDNPAYKGPWIHPEIDNPDYSANPNLYAYNDFGWVGVDVWQVKAGTIFDNIILTDSLEEATAFADRTWKAHKDAGKAAFDAVQEAKSKADAEAAKASAPEADAHAGHDHGHEHGKDEL